MKLTTKVGKRVKFRAPKDVKKNGGKAMSGTIIDETWADPNLNNSPSKTRNNNDDWGDYSFCSQLIKWDNGEYSIRLAYYRRRAGEDKWEFASQTTVNSDWKTIKLLLEKTLSMKKWFVDKPKI